MQKLNAAQQEAVTHFNGPMLVLAGPGSGKTRVITERVRYLVEEKKVMPAGILVITFTKAAAIEMKQRYQRLSKSRTGGVHFGTFHAIFFMILKHAYHYTAENIVRDDFRRDLLRKLVRDTNLELQDENEFLNDLESEISRVKGERIELKNYFSPLCSNEVFAEIFTRYQKALEQKRLIDFDDMLVLCYELFRSRPDVLAQWQKKFRYVLIDEFQDINRIQYDVIRMLAQPENNLFVVGDDDQAIYGFRGADSELMLGFGKDFPDAKQILLGMNYRSTANIVQNSLKLIENNVERYSKKLEANREGGSCLHIQEVKDPVEEAEYVLEEIQKCKENGIKEEEIAILFRVHTDARAVVEAMVERKIPFQMKEHLPNIYEHFIAKDIMAYFRLATGKRRRQDFLQVMNRPKRYLGRDSVSGSQVSFEDMRKFYCDKDWMIDRIDQFEWDVKMLMKMAPYAAIQYIRKRIGYDDFLKEYAFTHQINRSDLNEVLAEIEEAAKAFSSVEEWFAHVEEYTETLKVKEKERNRPRPGVRLMTIHASKGLEFKQVFLIAANEGRIPYQKAKTDKEIEEERRLFYVAMTRAKDFLKICYVKIKNGKEVTPSRFVDELLKS